MYMTSVHAEREVVKKYPKSADKQYLDKQGGVNKHKIC